MKKQSCLALFTAFLLLSACNSQSSVDDTASNDVSTPNIVTPSSSDAEPSLTKATEEDLEAAIKAIGKNFTLNTVDYSDVAGKTVATDNYFGKFMLSGQIDGYMSMTGDEHFVHSYDYNSNAITEDNDGFFDHGREDYHLDEFARMKELDKMLDLSSFYRKYGERLVFHSSDELSILRLLDFTNHPLSYYFGHAHDGIDITLSETMELERIDILGFNTTMLYDYVNNQPFVAPADNIFYSITVADIGTSKIDVIDDYANGKIEAPAPTLPMLLRVDRDGMPLYNGVTTEITGVLSSIIDDGAEASILCEGVPAYFPDASSLNPWDNYAKEITVEATVTGLNGAVVFENAELKSVGDEIGIEPYEIFDPSTWLEEFANEYNGPLMNGMPINVSLTYVGGEIAFEDAFALNFQFNSTLPVELKFTEGASEDIRSMFDDFFYGEGIEAGTKLDLTNLLFRWEGEPVIYVSETTTVEKSMTFDSLCEEVLGTTIPQPAAFDGWNIFYEDRYEIDETTLAKGVFAISYVKADEISTFAEDYGKLLTEDGFDLVETYKDDDGDTRYVYQKGTLVVRFCSPFTLEYDDGKVEYRTWVEVFDLSLTVAKQVHTEDEE